MKIQFKPNRALFDHPTHNYSILEDLRDFNIWTEKIKIKLLMELQNDSQTCEIF